MRQLAYIVAKVGREKFNLPVQIQRIENPRVEADIHPFEALYEKLPKQHGFEPKVDIEEEVRRMFELLMKPEIRSRIEEKKHVIIPKTWWSGVKREAQRIELINLEKEIKEDEERAKIFTGKK